VYIEVYMMRPRIAIEPGSEFDQQIEDYAKAQGLRKPHAYAELILEGLQRTDEHSDNTEKKQ
jgi:hypothetical protein